MFNLFLSPNDKQYEKILERLCAHVNNLPISYKLPGFTDEIYSVIYNLNNFFIKNPTYLQQFWRKDLPMRVQSWIKNIAIYLFLKQNIQMNCIRMNGKLVFININSIYMDCNNEDEYYTDRFRSQTPNFVEDVFEAILKFIAQFTRAGFLDLDQQQSFVVNIGNKRYEFLYTTNFFVDGGRICLYLDEEQALLEAIQSIDYNRIINDLFENPVLSGKNFYDLFLLASTAQQFLLGCLHDQQLHTPLFNEAVKEQRLDVRKSLYFLASVITNHLPNLYDLRRLLNQPSSSKWTNFQQELLADLKRVFLTPIAPNMLSAGKAQALSGDSWHDSWVSLTLMDIICLPTSLAGNILKPDSRLFLADVSDSDYQISTYLVYQSIPLSAQISDVYQPFLQMTVTSSKQTALGIPSTLEIALPAHLEKFLAQDLRDTFKLWTNQMLNLGDGLTTTTNNPLKTFLSQILVGVFFTDLLGDAELNINFSRRLGFYFWKTLEKSSVLSNGFAKTIIQDFLKDKMYLADADML